MSRHEVRIYDSSGSLQYNISGFSRLNYVKTVNTIGALELIMPKGDFEFDDFSIDMTLEVYKQYQGDMRLQNDTSYFLLDWEIMNDGGQDLVRLMAKDAMFLLDTRIVDYYSGSSEAQKSDYADDMMKEIVDENMGSSAPSDRQFPNFSIDGDVSASEEIDMAFAWRRVYSVCRDICGMAKDLGTDTFFDIERSSPGNYVFRTYTDYRGVDHTASSGDFRPVGKDFGNLSNVRLSEYHSNERNSIVVGGQGTQTERNKSSYSPIDAGYYRTIEMFQDARNETDSDRLSDYARQAYNRYKFTRTISGELVETPGMRYGIDFGFGDALTVEAFGYYADCIIQAVAVQVDQNKTEKIGIRLEGEVD